MAIPILRPALLAVAAAGLAVVGLLSAGHPAALAQQERATRTHRVTIDATSYSPKTLTVGVGDTVVWVNEDLFPHTVTARTGAFDSGDIAAGESWTFTAGAEGLFGYTCTYHPTMKGTLRSR